MSMSASALSRGFVGFANVRARARSIAARTGTDGTGVANIVVASASSGSASSACTCTSSSSRWPINGTSPISMLADDACARCQRSTACRTHCPTPLRTIGARDAVALRIAARAIAGDRNAGRATSHCSECTVRPIACATRASSRMKRLLPTPGKPGEEDHPMAARQRLERRFEIVPARDDEVAGAATQVRAQPHPEVRLRSRTAVGCAQQFRSPKSDWGSEDGGAWL